MARTDSEITISAAISYAENMRNGYRAFEKIRHVLAVVAQAEQRSGDATRLAEKLDRTNAELAQEIEALKQSTKDLKTAYDDSLSEAQDAHAKRIFVLDEQHQTHKRDLEAQMAGLQSQQGSEEIRLDDNINRLKVEEKRLEELIALLRGRLSKLKGDIPDVA